MKSENNINSQVVSLKLNQLLADYQILGMSCRGYHWNIKGQEFFELHEKFEEIYTDLHTKVDELAERILTLGFKPDHSFSRYLKSCALSEQENVSQAKNCVSGLVTGFEHLLASQRYLLTLCSDSGDEGTAAQMSDYISQQEKTLWKLKAYLQ
ncbi:Dps family protein [Vibrio coralliilyticus]|uniref:Dps family protein n=1 Tax=Vibrio coralliilyticus TaxID=190893 RepID=UPI00148B69D8|nr:Dps family protein [Vibrio coralliilyticus]NOI31710.1 DNA starvation/stationary phase protection protein [Vibrio coralliilyticus]NOI51060.1 DNA starvation/stationary phase protection protein [Vibrio coralliilyticus]